mmetsp:Transcript_92515/g.267097  ORF Transcript_92515/g.267097 Transcript_92515/m.267097 type:complete len:908 (+) Transcript_92515:2-2725(+)
MHNRGLAGSALKKDALASLQQQGFTHDESMTQGGGATTTAAAPVGPPAATASPPRKDEVALMPPDRADARCVTPNDSSCQAMHLSSMKLLGQAEEGLDEVRARRAANSEAHAQFLKRLNMQVSLIQETKWQLTGQLSEATGKMNTVQELMRRAEREAKDAELEVRRQRSKCTQGVEDILGREICGLRALRAAVAAQTGSTVKAESIVDCEVSEWTDGDCSVRCDDKCPQPNKTASPCGGIKKGKRSVLQKPSQFGAACPPLARIVPCNQVQCPVNCKMSEWSTWSSCTRACDGGIRQRTRNVLTEPRHGGDACDAATETQPCHSEACSQDCELDRWSDWSRCSAECGGGLQMRTRAVLKPAHGLDGKCPAERHEQRYQQRQCNQRACAGDEVCVDMQDLVVLLDSSADVTAEANQAQFEFLGRMLERYRGSAFGRSAARVAVVQYGNGEMNDDGSVTAPVTVSPLTMDLVGLRKRVASAAGTKFKGFANLAQALHVGQSLCQSGQTVEGRFPWSPANPACACPGQIEQLSSGQFDGTVEGCARSCWSKSGCRAFAFLPRSGGCTLHKDYCPMSMGECPASSGKALDPDSRPFNKPEGADARSSPCTVLVLTGSGRPPFTAAARATARKLWEGKTRTMVLAFSGGGRGDAELQGIASEPLQMSFMRVQGWSALGNETRSLVVDTCPGIGSRRPRYADSDCKATVQEACGTAAATVKCCSDTGCKTITDSDACVVTPAVKAKAICEAKKMRLCTPQELQGGTCCSDKCTERFAWSSQEVIEQQVLNELMSKACPELQSPSVTAQAEKQDQPWRLLREGSRCRTDKSGTAIDLAKVEQYRPNFVDGPLLKVCASIARKKKWEFFAVGKKADKGVCFKEVQCDSVGFRPASADYYQLLPDPLASSAAAAFM